MSSQPSAPTKRYIAPVTKRRFHSRGHAGSSAIASARSIRQHGPPGRVVGTYRNMARASRSASRRPASQRRWATVPTAARAEVIAARPQDRRRKASCRWSAGSAARSRGGGRDLRKRRRAVRRGQGGSLGRHGAVGAPAKMATRPDPCRVVGMVPHGTTGGHSSWKSFPALRRHGVVIKRTSTAPSAAGFVACVSRRRARGVTRSSPASETAQASSRIRGGARSASPARCRPVARWRPQRWRGPRLGDRARRKDARIVCTTQT